MLTYNDVAKQIGIPRGTLSRKLAEFNKAQPKSERINPDKVEPRGYARVHLFSAETADKIEAIMKATRGRAGRPGKEAKP